MIRQTGSVVGGGRTTGVTLQIGHLLVTTSIDLYRSQESAYLRQTHDEGEILMRRPVALRWIAAGATAAASAAIMLALPMSPAAAADNLSLNGGADGSSKAGGTSYGNVKDGNAGTYWAPGSATGYVSVKWSSATTVSSAVITQASGGGSISGWRVLNGDNSAVLASGSGSP